MNQQIPAEVYHQSQGCVNVHEMTLATSKDILAVDYTFSDQVLVFKAYRGDRK